MSATFHTEPGPGHKKALVLYRSLALFLPNGYDIQSVRVSAVCRGHILHSSFPYDETAAAPSNSGKTRRSHLGMQRLSKVDSGLPMWSRCPLLCIRVGLTRIIAMLIGSKVVKVGYRVVFGGMSEVGFERHWNLMATIRLSAI